MFFVLSHDVFSPSKILIHDFLEKSMALFKFWWNGVYIAFKIILKILRNQRLPVSWLRLSRIKQREDGKDVHFEIFELNHNWTIKVILRAIYCFLAICGKIASIRNGWVVGKGNLEGDQLSFRCQQNYTLDGPQRLTCQFNRSWSGRKPTCKGTKSMICVGKLFLFSWHFILFLHKATIYHRLRFFYSIKLLKW